MQTRPASRATNFRGTPAPTVAATPQRQTKRFTTRPRTLSRQQPMQLPGLWRHTALMPSLHRAKDHQVSEPTKHTDAKLPSGAPNTVFNDPLTNQPAFEVTSDTYDFDHEWQNRIFYGLIYDPSFIADEIDLARTQITVAIDLDKTTARKDDDFNGRDFRPSQMSGDTPWILRPNIDDVFARWHEAGIRLVLWSGGDRARVESFFREFPHMLELFARIITKENFGITELNYWAQKNGRAATINGIPVDNVLRQMAGYAHSPKWVSLLGHWGLIDDYDGIAAMRDKSPFGPFEVRQVTPLPRNFSRRHKDAGIIGSELALLEEEILKLKRP